METATLAILPVQTYHEIIYETYCNCPVAAYGHISFGLFALVYAEVFSP